jgi:hypothetical protein
MIKASFAIAIPGPQEFERTDTKFLTRIRSGDRVRAFIADEFASVRKQLGFRH